MRRLLSIMVPDFGQKTTATWELKDKNIDILLNWNLVNTTHLGVHKRITGAPQWSWTDVIWVDIVIDWLIDWLTDRSIDQLFCHLFGWHQDKHFQIGLQDGPKVTTKTWWFTFLHNFVWRSDWNLISNIAAYVSIFWKINVMTSCLKGLLAKLVHFSHKSHCC